MSYVKRKFYFTCRTVLVIIKVDELAANTQPNSAAELLAATKRFLAPNSAKLVSDWLAFIALRVVVAVESPAVAVAVLQPTALAVANERLGRQQPKIAVW